MSTDPKYCVTPRFRVSYPQVWEANTRFEGQKKKFSITMLFDKKEDLSALKKAFTNAAIDEWGADKSKWPKKFRSPFKDGDESQDKIGYAGTIVVAASANEDSPPQIVDQATRPILNRGDFYAGCYARASIRAFAYDKMGNSGVSFGLINIQKLDDGPKFSGRKDAADEFTAIDTDDLDQNALDDDLLL